MAAGQHALFMNILFHDNTRILREFILDIAWDIANDKYRVYVLNTFLSITRLPNMEHI